MLLPCTVTFGHASCWELSGNFRSLYIVFTWVACDSHMTLPVPCHMQVSWQGSEATGGLTTSGLPPFCGRHWVLDGWRGGAAQLWGPRQRPYLSHQPSQETHCECVCVCMCVSSLLLDFLFLWICTIVILSYLSSTSPPQLLDADILAHQGRVDEIMSHIQAFRDANHFLIAQIEDRGQELVRRWGPGWGSGGWYIVDLGR